MPKEPQDHKPKIDDDDFWSTSGANLLRKPGKLSRTAKIRTMGYIARLSQSNTGDIMLAYADLIEWAEANVIADLDEYAAWEDKHGTYAGIELFGGYAVVLGKLFGSKG